MTTATNVSNTSLSPPVYEAHIGGRWPHIPNKAAVVVLTLLGAVIVTAVGGNVLVLKAYRRDPLMRTVHNLYIMHLAVCDLLIGAVLMPLYLVYTVRHWSWPLGAWVCKLFQSVQYTVLCMSLVIVILVAWDRLAMIADWASFKLQDRKTRRRAYVRLGVGWLCSFLLFSPAILLWDVVTGVSVVPADECDTEFHAPLVLHVIFGVPVVALLVVHVLIHMALRTRRKFQSASRLRDNTGSSSTLALDAQSVGGPSAGMGASQRVPTGWSCPAQCGMTSFFDAKPETVQLTPLGSTDPSRGASPKTSKTTAPSSAERGHSSVDVEHGAAQLTLLSSAKTQLTASSSAIKVTSVVGARLETTENQENKIQGTGFKKTSFSQKRNSCYFHVHHTPTPEPVVKTTGGEACIGTPTSPTSNTCTSEDTQGLFMSHTIPADTSDDTQGLFMSHTTPAGTSVDSQDIFSDLDSMPSVFLYSREHAHPTKSKRNHDATTQSVSCLWNTHDKMVAISTQTSIPPTPTANKRTQTPGPPIQRRLSRKSKQHRYQVVDRIVTSGRKTSAMAPKKKTTLIPSGDGGHHAVSWEKGEPGPCCRRLQEKGVAVMGKCLVLVLIVCWLPYSLATIVLAACESCRNRDVQEVFIWLLWFKACLDPLLYAFASHRFRLNLRQMFVRVCHCTPSKRDPCEVCGSL